MTWTWRCTILFSLLGDLFEIFYCKEFKKKTKNTVLCKSSKRLDHHQSYFKAEETEAQRGGLACPITQLVWTRISENREVACPLLVTCSLFYITVAQSGSHQHHFLGMLKGFYRDFPAGPVVKTPCSQCKGHRFNSWSGN